MADRLQEALNEGRLSLGEYDDRLKEAYAAKTYGELDGLLRDLPTVVPAEKAQLAATTPTVPQPIVAPQPRRGLPNWMLAMWGSWLTSSLICTVIWVATNPTGYPWPVWVAGPWGAMLLARTVMAYASGDAHGYEQAEKERERQSRQDRAESRYRRREKRHR